MRERTKLEELVYNIKQWFKSLTRKERKKTSIIRQLNKWVEGNSTFTYSEYLDFEGTARYEFTNSHISFTVFPEYEKENLNGGGFWYGARHHVPIKLAKDIINFLYKYSKK